MKKNKSTAILMAFLLFVIFINADLTGVAFAAQTTVNTMSDTFGTAWNRQQAMNTEIYTFIGTIDTEAEIKALYNFENSDINTLIGAYTLGEFTGTSIEDDSTIKVALQAIETALELPEIVTYSGTIVSPQSVYDNDATNHAVTILVNVPEAFTITALRISCDADPTTEPTLTFKHKAAGVGYGTPTVIEAVTTSAGIATITTGIDDSTIPANTKLFITLSDPDNALKEISWQIDGTKD